MKLEQFLPTFRNVLLQEVQEVKTEGGIYIPSSSLLTQGSKLYEVIKIGTKCEELQAGDKVYLSPGVNGSSRRIERTDYIMVYEQQVEGRFRKEIVSEVKDFYIPEVEF